MFVLGNLFYALATLTDFLLTVMNWLIIIGALLSWVSPDPYNPIVKFIYRTTEPLLAPFRKIVPSYSMGVDFSPLFALLVIWFLKLFLVRTLFSLAAKFS